MRKQILIILLSSLVCLSILGFTTKIISVNNKTVSAIEVKPVKQFEYVIVPEKIDINETDLFLNAIGHYESSNRYDIVNRFGYMGKYQFGRKTLKNLGYDVSKQEFLNSPYLQEKAMLDLLSHNKKILQKYIDYWDGKEINDVVITESGILAAAHLAGPGNVKRFLREGKEFKDGNGTKLTRYLTHFSGYELNLN